MSSTLGQRIGVWLGARERPTSLVLAHLLASRADVLEAVDLEPTDEPSALAERFQAIADSHAATLDGEQRYSVGAYKGARSAGVHFFVAGRRAELAQAGTGAGDVIDATGKAVVRAALRAQRQSEQHAEQMQRMVVGSLQGMLGMLSQQLTLLGEENKALRAEQSKHVELTQQLLDKKLERDIAAAEASTMNALKARGMTRLEALFDVGIANMTGASPLLELFKSLDDNQRRGLVAALTEEQRKKLWGILAQGHDAELAKEKLYGEDARREALGAAGSSVTGGGAAS